MLMVSANLQDNQLSYEAGQPTRFQPEWLVKANANETMRGLVLQRRDVTGWMTISLSINAWPADRCRIARIIGVLAGGNG